MPSSFTQSLSACAARLEKVLDELLPRSEGAQTVVADAMRYAALGGGKRIRPFLLTETAKMLGCETLGVWHTAAALECVHSYSLIHDDLPCMDDDDLRRGKPTVHKVYGEAIALLAGDALLNHSFEILASEDVHADAGLRLELISELARAGGIGGMIGGQVIDITVSQMTRDEALITELQTLKTGALIGYAAFAGGRLAGASPTELGRLKSYARNIGLAFQIKDDILDVEGETQYVGKTTGKDENFGKVTFVTLFGLEGARHRAHDLGEEAKGHLDVFGDDAHCLLQIVDFVLKRTY